MNKKARQIFKFLENEKSFKGEIKKHFFEGESPSLMYHNTSIFKLPLLVIHLVLLTHLVHSMSCGNFKK